MDEYIRQLRATYEAELYYFSLMGCMTLIDTCSALNSSNGDTTGLLFKNWFNNYLPEYVNNNLDDAISFSADECWKFRCRLLHQGRSRIDAISMNSNVKSGKISFRIGPGTFHRCNFEGIYYLDIKIFMEDVIKGVLKWRKDTENSPHVQINYNQMIKIVTILPEMGGRPGIYVC